MTNLDKVYGSTTSNTIRGLHVSRAGGLSGPTSSMSTDRQY